MQCSQRTWRSACSAHNTYRPAAALKVAFESSTWREQNDSLISHWELGEGGGKATPRLRDNGVVSGGDASRTMSQRQRKSLSALEEHKAHNASEEQDGESSTTRGVTPVYRPRMVSGPSLPQIWVGQTGVGGEQNGPHSLDQGSSKHTSPQDFPKWLWWKASEQVAARRGKSGRDDSRSMILKIATADQRLLGSMPKPTSAEGWKKHMLEVQNFVAEVQAARREKRELDGDLRARIKYVLDYVGYPVAPEDSPLKDRSPLPWVVDTSARSELSARDWLDAEIRGFAAHMQPTTAEKTARKFVVDETRAMIRACMGNDGVGIELYGSQNTGLALPYSDLDFRLFDQRKEGNPKYAPKILNRMRALSHKMTQGRNYMCVTFREGSFPIINCQHRATGIDVQIVCSTPAYRQGKVTAQYMREIPGLREVYLVVRTMLGMRKLVDVYTGGVGSYGILMMIVAALKRQPPGWKQQPPATPASLLLHFFDFYGHLDTTKRALAVHPRTYFLKRPRTPEHAEHMKAALARDDRVRAGQWKMCEHVDYQPYLLCLQDPATPTNDLGRKGDAIKHVLATIRYFNFGLWMDMYDHSQGKAGTKQRRSLLEGVVGKCFEVYAARRARVEEYGNEILGGVHQRGVQARGFKRVIGRSGWKTLEVNGE